MTTLGQTIEETLSMLRGYVRDQELSTHLLSGISSSSTSINVNDATVLSRGRAEIGSELVWIDSVNRSTNTATIAPYGRGMDGSTAVSHSTNDRVIFQPLFPRYRVKQAINETIQSLSGPLYGIGMTNFTANPVYVTYAMPAEANWIIAAEWQSVGPTREWIPLQRFHFNRTVNTDVWPTGHTIDIYDSISPGRTISVKYGKDLMALNSESDNFTDTGLMERSRDCIVYGAAWRLLSSVDMGLIATRAIESNTMDSKIAPGAGQNASKFMFQLFQSRLNEERDYLNNEHPIQPHYTR